ncbi:hypothetical protein EV34_14805, partial [Staphylococcus aureus]
TNLEEAYMYQTIIIGGGPSGLMAAVAASEQSSRVLLIGKKKGLGRKIKISGGGRCNVTNRLPYACLLDTNDAADEEDSPNAIVGMEAKKNESNTFSVEPNSNNNIDITIKRQSRRKTEPRL